MADIFNLTDTWNAAGTTFSAIKMNVTNTASAAASKLIDLQVGGASQVSADKAGNITLGDVNGSGGYITDYYKSAALGAGITTAGAGAYGVSLASTRALMWVNGGDAVAGTPDTNLWRDNAAGALAQRNSTNAQSFRVYNTYTDASNYERGVFDWSTTANTLTIGTQKAGTGTKRSLVIDGSGGGAYGIEIKAAQDASDYIKLNATGGIDIFNAGVHVTRLSGGSGFDFGSGNGSMRWGAGIGLGADVAIGRLAAGVVEVNNGTAGTGAALKCATIRRSAPVTKTADFTVADTDSYIILNKGSAGVVTLPAAANYTGREISFTNIQAFAWTSASANVVPRVGGAAATAMLAATDGAWCKLVSDGTNWINLQGTP